GRPSISLRYACPQIIVFLSWRSRDENGRTMSGRSSGASCPPGSSTGVEPVDQTQSRAAEQAARQGLYDPRADHDACGVGFVVHMKGVKSHDIVEKALQVLVNLEHRGACGC